MLKINFIQKYSLEIAKVINSDNLFFYWKARVALFALLKAMEVKPGDEVILPAFTCVVVPNAILYLGAKPVYIDVTHQTFNMDVCQLEAVITERTKVIICQNTYGLSTDLDQLNAIAKRHNIFTIEDCTHGFGGTYDDKPNGQFCDAAFFSTQWNKPFSTGIGGFAITKHIDIAEKLKLLQQGIIQPSFKERLNLKLLYWVRRYLLNEYTYWKLVKLYRLLSKYNLVVGSSSGEEITSTNIPARYFKAFTETQAREGIRNLAKLPNMLATRKQNAAVYTEYLKKHGKQHVDTQFATNHAFLKYPILVHNRAVFLDLAEQHQIELGDWFLSPLHPVQGDLTAWQLDIDHFPVAKDLARQVVNLPTTPINIDRVLMFLDTNLEMIV